MYETVPYCFQISEEIIRTPNRTAFTASEAEIGARPSKDWRIDLLSLPFARIRKFHVSIFVSRFGFSDLLGHREEEELSLYNVRDNVQRLVSILKEVPSIKELRVRASLLNIEWLDPESITAAEFLLNPFMCLRNISRPSLDNIQVGVISESDRLDAYFIGTKRTGTCYTPEVDFVVPHDILTSSSGYYEPVADLSGVKVLRFREHAISSKDYKPGEEDETFATYVSKWEKLLASDDPAPPVPPLAQTYEDVKDLLWDLRKLGVPRRGESEEQFDRIWNYQPPGRLPDILTRLLHRARVAREADGKGDMAEIQQEMHTLWAEFVAEQDASRRKVKDRFVRMALPPAGQCSVVPELSQKSVTGEPSRLSPPLLEPPHYNSQGESISFIGMPYGSKPRARLVTPAVVDAMDEMITRRDEIDG